MCGNYCEASELPSVVSQMMINYCRPSLSIFDTMLSGLLSFILDAKLWSVFGGLLVLT
jgi:hypothetical protein